MPIRWTVNHAERLVDVVLDGEISKDDATQFFDAIEAADAIPYRKFVDATNTPAKIDEKILATVGDRMARNRSRSGLPPAAIPVRESQSGRFGQPVG